MPEFAETEAGTTTPPDLHPHVVDPEPLDIRTVESKPTRRQSVKATTDNLSQIVGWITENGHAASLGDGQLTIQTLEGPFTVRPGDQVLRGVQGEFYRVDPEIYKESYTDLGPAADA